MIVGSVAKKSKYIFEFVFKLDVYLSGQNI